MAKPYQVREWSKWDVSRLRWLVEKGYSGAEAAKDLRRSYGALRFKAHKLGVKFRIQRARSRGKK